MMMTQSYYGGDFETFHRSSTHRTVPNVGYYERPTPYAYYDQPRQDLRSEFVGRPLTRQALIHEPELEGPIGNARRRIAVACSRCRRRKIKCSGDPGDGTGCQACRASGADVNQCAFNRVGSTVLSMPSGVEAYPQASSAGGTASHGSLYSNAAAANDWPQSNHHHQPHHRPSLPLLHTRSSFADGYDQYQESPIDYTYASSTIPRNDSIASSIGSLENYRSWGSSSGPLSAPVTSNVYDQPSAAYSFGSLQAPQASTYQHPSSSRLPSVTSDNFSPLNMASMHSSLPSHTERRLPVPYTVHYGSQSDSSGPQLPRITPGTLSDAKAHITGVHSSSAMPWSRDTGSSNVRAPSASTLPTPQRMGLPLPNSQHHASTPVSEPAFGYQFPGISSSGSPEISAATAPHLELYQSTAPNTSSTTTMPPPSGTYRYSNASTNSSLTGLPSGLPSVAVLDDAFSRPATVISRTNETPQASLYSFSTDDGGVERPSTADSDRNSSSPSHSAASTGSTATYNGPLSQPQPRQHASVEALRRQSSFDQQQQRASTAQRMSVQNLNGRY